MYIGVHVCIYSSCSTRLPPPYPTLTYPPPHTHAQTMSMHSDFDTLCPLLGGCGPVGVTDDKGVDRDTVTDTDTEAAVKGGVDGGVDGIERPSSAPNESKQHCR